MPMYNREGKSGEKERDEDEREEEKKSDRKGIQSEEGEKKDEKYVYVPSAELFQTPSVPGSARGHLVSPSTCRPSGSVSC